ncbi:glycoside hydrolase family 30 protein [Tilletiaria anomala UBC 951]|uniref:Glycoside hydrolase family 30 protein n=1 Tax=Tilletiaria anomala (strain ATCC 24038 / CBS 436.72 / UBC 951) TaxID=1037660 RepID=A0A066VVD9_TILAU|nr:glycoside hydrolase family 30 protein [Tilletiaria anomala UBC 951]KDN44248.1 glycoside hydrolase family 30 protein [Tilletiaria anomala UBC 951]
MTTSLLKICQLLLLLSSYQAHFIAAKSQWDVRAAVSPDTSSNVKPANAAPAGIGASASIATNSNTNDFLPFFMMDLGPFDSNGEPIKYSNFGAAYAPGRAEKDTKCVVDSCRQQMKGQPQPQSGPQGAGISPAQPQKQEDAVAGNQDAALAGAASRASSQALATHRLKGAAKAGAKAKSKAPSGGSLNAHTQVPGTAPAGAALVGSHVLATYGVYGQQNAGTMINTNPNARGPGNANAHGGATASGPRVLASYGLKGQASKGNGNGKGKGSGKSKGKGKGTSSGMNVAGNAVGTNKIVQAAAVGAGGTSAGGAAGAGMAIAAQHQQQKQFELWHRCQRAGPSEEETKAESTGGAVMGGTYAQSQSGTGASSGSGSRAGSPRNSPSSSSSSPSIGMHELNTVFKSGYEAGLRAAAKLTSDSSGVSGASSSSSPFSGAGSLPHATSASTRSSGSQAGSTHGSSGAASGGEHPVSSGHSSLAANGGLTVEDADEDDEDENTPAYNAALALAAVPHPRRLKQACWPSKAQLRIGSNGSGGSYIGAAHGGVNSCNIGAASSVQNSSGNSSSNMPAQSSNLPENSGISAATMKWFHKIFRKPLADILPFLLVDFERQGLLKNPHEAQPSTSRSVQHRVAGAGFKAQMQQMQKRYVPQQYPMKMRGKADKGKGKGQKAKGTSVTQGARGSGGAPVAAALPAAAATAEVESAQGSMAYLTTEDMTAENGWTVLQGKQAFVPGSGKAPGGTANVVIDLQKTYQRMDGAGVALTDAAAQVLQGLKEYNPQNYQHALQDIFAGPTGLTILRIPIGATDFSSDPAYSLADQPLLSGMAKISSVFTFGIVHSTIMPVLQDILTINPSVKIVLTSWSAPALKHGMQNLYAAYLAHAVASYQKAGIVPWALTVQNEPAFQGSYPSMIVQPQEENQIAGALRRLLPEGVKLLVHDHIFNYPQSATAAVLTSPANVDGVAWHCYAGNPEQSQQTQQALAKAGQGNKEFHLTECSATVPNSGMWEGMKWWLANLMFGLPQYGVQSIVSWNLALDQKNGPLLKTAPCKNCQGLLTINGAQVKRNFVWFFSRHFATATFCNAVRVDSKVSLQSAKCLSRR